LSRRFIIHFEALDAEATVKEMEGYLKRVNHDCVKLLGEHAARK
jgi:hypothetical protein